MPNPIPNFNNDFVLPPHLGNPANPREQSPYLCTTLDLCKKLGTSPARIRILRGYLEFRDHLCKYGMNVGFQWLDGSFLENVEQREGRDPRDLDIVTVFWGFSLEAQARLLSDFPEFWRPDLSKSRFYLDHYALDTSEPEHAAQSSGYWMSLFSHHRSGLWKGMLKIELGTPEIDSIARKYLEGIR